MPTSWEQRTGAQAEVYHLTQKHNRRQQHQRTAQIEAARNLVPPQAGRLRVFLRIGPVAIVAVLLRPVVHQAGGMHAQYPPIERSLQAGRFGIVESQVVHEAGVLAHVHHTVLAAALHVVGDAVERAHHDTAQPILGQLVKQIIPILLIVRPALLIASSVFKSDASDADDCRRWNRPAWKSVRMTSAFRTKPMRNRRVLSSRNHPTAPPISSTHSWYSGCWSAGSRARRRLTVTSTSVTSANAAYPSAMQSHASTANGWNSFSNEVYGRFGGMPMIICVMWFGTPIRRYVWRLSEKPRLPKPKSAPRRCSNPTSPVLFTAYSMPHFTPSVGRTYRKVKLSRVASVSTMCTSSPYCTVRLSTVRIMENGDTSTVPTVREHPCRFVNRFGNQPAKRSHVPLLFAYRPISYGAALPHCPSTYGSYEKATSSPQLSASPFAKTTPTTTTTLMICRFHSSLITA
uniref:Uncharacterized protein n=1 Tax=Anopheles melas TaxID=34690 RepID=A0A182UAS4_9DIPT